MLLPTLPSFDTFDMKCWSNNFADIFTSFSSKMSKLINFSTIYHYIWKTQDGGFPPFLYLLAWLNLLIFQKFSLWVFFSNGSIKIYFYWPWEIPNDSYHTSFNSSTNQSFHVSHHKLNRESISNQQFFNTYDLSRKIQIHLFNSRDPNCMQNT